MTTTSKLDAALAYASWGWRVLPVQENSKIPASAHGVKDATTDEAQIREWWAQNPNFNIGIAAGAQSGILVFDIDPRNGGDDSWDVWVGEHGALPDGAYQLTAGGGQHYLANYDEAIKSCKMRDGIDLLSDGRYFLASPSSINGKEYAWEASSDPFEGVAPVTIPERWITALQVRKFVDNAERNTTLITGNRNAGLTAIAGSMRHFGMTEQAILAALTVENDTRCETPLPMSEVKQIAHSVSRYTPEVDSAADAALGDDAAERLFTARAPEIEQQYDATTLRATEYVIDGFIGMGLTILAGEPGGGKTSIVVPLIAHAAHLCHSDSFLKPELRRHVVYVSEDTEQVERCIYAMNQYGNLGLEQSEFSEWFHLHEAHRASPRSIAQMLTYLDEQYTYSLENGFVVKPVIVFDTSNATIDIENENDNSEVGKVIALLKESANGMAIIVVAHTAKALNRGDLETLTPRGASAWIGDARATVYLFRDEAIPEARFLALGKRRFEPTYTEIRFDSETHSETVLTPWGTSQDVGLRVVAAQASNKEERKEAAKLGKKAVFELDLQRQQDVILTELRKLPIDQYMTTNEVAAIESGNKNKRLDLVNAMIEKGLIERFNLASDTRVEKRSRQHVIGLRIAKGYKYESDGE